MNYFENNSSDSEYDESDVELQEAFAAGAIKPGINTVSTQKHFVNDIKGLREKAKEMALNLSWIERLDVVTAQAPLAPELAAQMLEQEQKRESQLKNNKKLPQFAPSEDPVLNDFKRELMFHRQAQATILEAVPKIKAAGLLITRPDDYFAEMAKSDEHMQKIREKLMQKQVQQQRSEKVKQLRMQRKEGKALQNQAKLERQKEKKEIMEQVKKVRKGTSNDMGFLDGRRPIQKSKTLSKKSAERRDLRDKKFGFGGKKSGMKRNTKDSAADVSEYRTSGKPRRFASKNKSATQRNGKNKSAAKRPGKNRRQMSKAKNKK